jgi:hypothetical protein
MTTTAIKNYIDTQARLIELQRIELEKTRNYLARILAANGNLITVEAVEFEVPENAIFTAKEVGGETLHIYTCSVEGLTSEMEIINKYYRELNR